MLALNGSEDEFVSKEEKVNFAREMKAAAVTDRSIDYPGAKHAFTNPEATALGKKFNLPIGYNEERRS